jgi:hypothetical protein
MKNRPYTLIFKDSTTGEISHVVVECEIRSDAYAETPPDAQQLYSGQTDDVKEAYAACVDWLELQAEKARERAEWLMRLAAEVDSQLEKMEDVTT